MDKKITNEQLYELLKSFKEESKGFKTYTNRQFFKIREEQRAMRRSTESLQERMMNLEK